MYLGGRIFNSAELSQEEIDFLMSIGSKSKPAIVDQVPTVFNDN